MLIMAFVASLIFCWFVVGIVVWSLGTDSNIIDGEVRELPSDDMAWLQDELAVARQRPAQAPVLPPLPMKKA